MSTSSRIPLSQQIEALDAVIDVLRVQKRERMTAQVEAARDTLAWLQANANDVREGVKLMRAVGGGTVEVRPIDHDDTPLGL